VYFPLLETVWLALGLELKSPPALVHEVELKKL
jgi:hypothetical protein